MVQGKVHGVVISDASRIAKKIAWYVWPVTLTFHWLFLRRWPGSAVLYLRPKRQKLRFRELHRVYQNICIIDNDWSHTHMYVHVIQSMDTMVSNQYNVAVETLNACIYLCSTLDGDLTDNSKYLVHRVWLNTAMASLNWKWLYPRIYKVIKSI